MSARKTPAQHTVRVKQYAGQYRWDRLSANHVPVAQSVRAWPWWEKRHCVAAAKSEARLTGARLVVDGQEVKP